MRMQELSAGFLGIFVRHISCRMPGTRDAHSQSTFYFKTYEFAGGGLWIKSHMHMHDGNLSHLCIESCNLHFKTSSGSSSFVHTYVISFLKCLSFVKKT